MADRDPGEGPSLFDLPLTAEERRREEEARRRVPEAGREPRGGREPARPSPHGRGSRELPLFPGGAEPAECWDVGAGVDGAVDDGAVEEDAASAEPAGRSFWDEPEPTPPAPGGHTEPLAGAAHDWSDLEAAGAQSGALAAEGAGRTEAEPFDGEPTERPAEPPRTAPLGHRLAAVLLDGGLLLVVSATAIVGSYLMGVRWGVADLGPLAAFLLVFSFVYSVVPLAFWGRTPGMAMARILARGGDGGPLTFGQTALRWLGGLLTLALAGLPLLLALPSLGGRSLADRLSGTRTWLPPA